ncbi:class I SAM-dependent DNA methyltransferase [Oceanobacillus kapialis]|uniref:class I SAM-dependent DNA methyltransferase n=1 Tax=Oceanobacillus kapialis TaxID=481353 RepID=UPI0038513CA7
MAYKQMANVYDRLMENAPYEKWLTFTESIFKQYGKSVQSIADLGCGTGEITKRLALNGYRVTGVDYSADMLTFAEQKCSGAGLTVQWLHQDLTELQGLQELDAAISYCDVMNYITTEEDLSRVFQNVAESLKEDGIFIFDVHSIHQVEENYVNQTFADVMEDASYIWFCHQGDEPGEMFHELTFFQSQQDNTYVRFDEMHHQRTFTPEFYINLLKETGFKNINLYGDFQEKDESTIGNAERIFFSAEKGEG